MKSLAHFRGTLLIPLLPSVTKIETLRPGQHRTTYQSGRAHRVLMNPFLDHLHCRTRRQYLALKKRDIPILCDVTVIKKQLKTRNVTLLKKV